MYKPKKMEELIGRRAFWSWAIALCVLAASCAQSPAGDSPSPTTDPVPVTRLTGDDLSDVVPESLATTVAPSPVPGATNAAPFNLYLGEELGLIDYAVDRAVAECMASVGYRQLAENTAGTPERAFQELVITLATFGPVSKEAAIRDGLGQQPAPEAASIISTDPSFDAAVDECRTDVWGQLGAEARATYSSYFELGNQLYAEFIAQYPTEPIRDLYRVWLGCVADGGFPADNAEAFLEDFDPSRFGIPMGTVVEDEPGGQPSYEPGTVEVLTPARGARYEPTEDEVAFAVADYRCRESTGFNAEILGFVEEIEGMVVADQEAVLAELNPAIEELARRSAALSGTDG